MCVETEASSRRRGRAAQEEGDFAGRRIQSSSGKIKEEIGMLEEEHKKQQKGHRKTMGEISGALGPVVAAINAAPPAAAPLLVSSDMLTKEVLANHLATDQALAGINCDQAHALMNSVFSLLNAQAKAAAEGGPAAAAVAAAPAATAVAAAPAVAQAAGAPPQAMGADNESKVSEDEALSEDVDEEQMKVVESKINAERRRRDEHNNNKKKKGCRAR